MSAPYKVLLGIDMETDVGSFSNDYRGVAEGTPLLLDMLDRRGVATTFYFTGDAAVRNTEIVRLVQSLGHEVGTHSLFHETVGDEFVQSFGTRPILPEEIPIRIGKCTEWVADITGMKPKSFRSPRLCGSTNVVNELERLGYETDASYPMYFYRNQFFPYHPHKDDWLETGEMKILEIPNFCDMLMTSSDPELERDRDPWHVYRVFGAEAHYAFIENFLAFTKDMGQQPVISLYLHPWEFVEMPHKIPTSEGTVILEPFIVTNTGDVALKELDALIGIMQSDGALFCKAEDLIL